MKKFKFLVVLTTRDNDYQQEQEIVAREKARRLGVDVEVIDANNDPIVQSQQLLQCIQSSTQRPDGIIVEPVGGTALPIVARAAADAGIGWVVLNREIDYAAEIRRTRNVPVFCITSNHDEIGRIQGRQLTAMLPKGGSVLYIEGPSPVRPQIFRSGLCEAIGPWGVVSTRLRLGYASLLRCELKLS